MRLPRFSLRMMLMAVTAIAVCCFAAQLHRRRLRQSIQRLESQGAAFEVDESWIDAVWMRRPRQATIVLSLHGATGQLQIGDRALPSADASGEEIAKLKQALVDFGVIDPRVVYQRR